MIIFMLMLMWIILVIYKIILHYSEITFENIIHLLRMWHLWSGNIVGKLVMLNVYGEKSVICSPILSICL